MTLLLIHMYLFLGAALIKIPIVILTYILDIQGRLLLSNYLNLNARIIIFALPNHLFGPNSIPLSLEKLRRSRKSTVFLLYRFYFSLSSFTETRIPLYHLHNEQKGKHSNCFRHNLSILKFKYLSYSKRANRN